MKIGALALLVSTPLAAATWTFPTGPPKLEGHLSLALARDEASYTSFGGMSGGAVPIAKKPAGLSPDAKYGCGVILRGNSRCWILDGDDDRGWSIYLDWRGDGDLSAVAPRKFERVGASHQLQIDVDEGDVRWPLRLGVSRLKAPPGSPEPRGGVPDIVAVSIASGAERSGTIELDGKPYPFRLSGTRGRYNAADCTIAIDRFGEGGFDKYDVSERFVNLAGRSFEFSVDGGGTSLTLTELADARPGRPGLSPNTAAPRFSVRDSEGMPRYLSAYKGKMLLVEFWSTACGPCRDEAPHLLELYRSIPRGTIDFLGISSDTSVDAMREFVLQNKLPWPQVLEPFAGPLHRLFHLDGDPTYYLIGSSGEILAGWVDPAQTSDQVMRFMTRR